MGMTAILINEPWPFVKIFNPPFTEGSIWSLKKIDPGVSEKSFKGVDGQTEDDGRQVITIAHPGPCSDELIKKIDVSGVEYLCYHLYAKYSDK